MLPSQFFGTIGDRFDEGYAVRSLLSEERKAQFFVASNFKKLTNFVKLAVESYDV